MKTIINHVFGNIDEYDYQGYKLSLDLEGDSEADALNQGWGIQNGEWYASRMVRLDLSKYNKQPKTIKDHSFTIADNTYPLEPINRVFDEFVIARKFTPLYDVSSDIDRVKWLLVHKGDRLVAFTKFVLYDEGIESQFTAWNYEEPKLSIGIKIVDHEVQYAKSLGYKYLYIGPGYGHACLYKCRFDGFEFWTGSEWCDSVDLYHTLCNRDSSINTLEQLSKLIWNK